MDCCWLCSCDERRCVGAGGAQQAGAGDGGGGQRNEFGVPEM